MKPENTVICPACGEGQLTARVDMEEVEYRGRKGRVPTHYSICGVCGSEVADAEQLRENKRAIQAFRKEVDGLLSGDQVRAIRKQYGISQTEAALIFGGGKVAFSKYENNEISQSESMDRLLRLVSINYEAFEDLLRITKVELQRENKFSLKPPVYGAPQADRYILILRKKIDSCFSGSFDTVLVDTWNKQDVLYQPPKKFLEQKSQAGKIKWIH